MFSSFLKYFIAFCFVWVASTINAQPPIIISELFLDPSPSLFLPELEFVELYNTSDRPVNLKGWSLVDKSFDGFVFDTVTIQPNQFLICSKKSENMDYSEYGDTYVDSKFPRLNNDHEIVVLKNHDDEIIHGVEIFNTSIVPSSKRNGGWTIEPQDLNCFNSWRFSENTKGGTPGSKPSKSTINYIENTIKSIEITGENNITITFNQPKSTTFLQTPTQFLIDGIDTPSKIEITDPFNRSATLTFSKSFQRKESYSITIRNVITCGKLQPFYETDIGIPEQVLRHDILLNEVLFYGDTEFIEVVNVSNKIIDATDLRIGIFDKNQIPSSINKLAETSQLLFPGVFYVFTKSKHNLINRYPLANTATVFDAPISQLQNDGATLKILDDAANTIDEFSYSEDLHFSLYSNTSNISLERISLKDTNYSKHNWHSASASSGYATPTLANSQNNSVIIDNKFSLSEKVISPNGDGHRDFTSIKYQFPTPGYVLTCNLYTDKGQLIGSIVQNETMATSGLLKWDGINQYGAIVKEGFYIVTFEYFNLDGEQGFEKKVIGVTR